MAQDESPDLPEAEGLPRNTFICSMDWDSMKGSEKVRFCEQCQNKVYDLRGLSKEELVEFIRHEGGQVCGLAHFDANGRFVNGECTRDGGVLPLLGVLMPPSPMDEVRRKITEARQRLASLQEWKKLLKARGEDKP